MNFIEGRFELHHYKNPGSFRINNLKVTHLYVRCPSEPNSHLTRRKRKRECCRKYIDTVNGKRDSRSTQSSRHPISMPCLQICTITGRPIGLPLFSKTADVKHGTLSIEAGAHEGCDLWVIPEH